MAQEREVILFDNAGVGRSTGEVPTTFAGWAKDMIAFIKALELKQVDLYGYSMGGLAVLEVALAAPELVRKLIMAGSKASVPSKGPVAGIVWPQEDVPIESTMRLVEAKTLEEGRDAIRYSLFPPSDRAGAAFDQYWRRLSARKAEPAQLDLLPMEKGGNSQIASVMDAGQPQPNSSFDRLGELKMPVLVMNGDYDTLVPTSRSWELMQQIENAELIIYPRSGHGFLWQYPKRVAEDTNRFLDGTDFE